MTYIDLFTAFMIGVTGSGHCLSMCGSICAILNMQPKENISVETDLIKDSKKINHQAQKLEVSPITHGANKENRPQVTAIRNTPFLRFIFSYNLGRILSYSLIGGLVGGAFSSISTLGDMNHGLAYLRLLAAIFLILLALYLSKIWQGLHYIEGVGKKIWRFISPIAVKLIPLQSSFQAFKAGILWGWLPCGLVYSALTWSAASGSMLNGALLMFSFGLGTLPMMFGLSLTSLNLQTLLERSAFRYIAALFLLIYGIYQINMVLHMLNT